MEGEYYFMADTTPHARVPEHHTHNTHDDTIMTDAADSPFYDTPRSSRKRQHTDFHQPEPADPFYDNTTSPSSKRRRSSNWPLVTVASPPPTSTPTQTHRSISRKSKSPGSAIHRRPATSPPPPTPGKEIRERESRFKEGSMHDRKSEAPPTLFTRPVTAAAMLESPVRGAGVGPGVESLMEEYLGMQGTSPTKRVDGKVIGTEKMERPKKGLHMLHANASVAGSSISGAQSHAESQGGASGIFRFGRNWANAFNPVNLYHTISRNYREAKRDLEAQALEEARRKAMEEQKKKAEAAYAELKNKGQLGMLGTHKVEGFADGYGPANANRDSGIDMTDNSPIEEQQTCSTVSNEKELPPTPAEAPAHVLAEAPSLQNSAVRSHRKLFKWGSISNLKKVKSISNFHGRNDSASSISPDKEAFPETPSTTTLDTLHPPGTDTVRTITRSSSRRDLQKQARLTKRVSDLEAKLHAAKRELDAAIATPNGTTIPPVPRIPPSLAHIVKGNADEGWKGSWRGRGKLPFKKFVPGTLPTLPSEGVLFPNAKTEEKDDEGKANADQLRQFAAEQLNEEKETQDVAMADVEVNDEDTPVRPRSRKADQPSEQLDNEWDILMASIEPLDAQPAAEVSAPVKKPTKRIRKPNKLDADAIYRPSTDADDDSDNIPARPSRKKRNAATSKIPVKNSSPAPSTGLYLHPTNPSIAPPILSPSPHDEEEDFSVQRTLETLTEVSGDELGNMGDTGTMRRIKRTTITTVQAHVVNINAQPEHPTTLAPAPVAAPVEADDGYSSGDGFLSLNASLANTPAQGVSTRPTTPPSVSNFNLNVNGKKGPKPSPSGKSNSGKLQKSSPAKSPGQAPEQALALTLAEGQKAKVKRSNATHGRLQKKGGASTKQQQQETEDFPVSVTPGTDHRGEVVPPVPTIREMVFEEKEREKVKGKEEEEEENVKGVKGTEGKRKRGGRGLLPEQQWEWPEDVF